jgi:hypothetical protein
MHSASGSMGVSKKYHTNPIMLMNVIKTACTVYSIMQGLSVLREKMSITGIINEISAILYFHV